MHQHPQHHLFLLTLGRARGVVTLYYEAVRPSTSLGGHAISLRAVYAEQHTDPVTGLTQTLVSHSYVETKLAPLTAAALDLDIDSFNDSGFGVPGAQNHSAHEDAMEDRPSLPGKFIAVNDDETDQTYGCTTRIGTRASTLLPWPAM